MYWIERVDMSCFNCKYNDGRCYTSMPPKFKCTLTGEFHTSNYQCENDSPSRDLLYYCDNKYGVTVVENDISALANNGIMLNKDECESLIAFIKSHEREDIPDDVWDICMKMYDEVYSE